MTTSPPALRDRRLHGYLMPGGVWLRRSHPLGRYAGYLLEVVRRLLDAPLAKRSASGIDEVLQRVEDLLLGALWVRRQHACVI
jgi:hypothetical protein